MPALARNRRLLTLILRVFAAACCFVSIIPARAAGADSAEVHVGSETVFLVTSFSSFSAAERAEIVNRRITKILSEPQLDPSGIKTEVLADGSPAVVLDDLPIVAATVDDARVLETSPDELAARWADLLRTRITQLKPLYTRQASVNVKVLSEHRIFLLVFQVGLLLLASFTCGAIFVRLGQPAVIGQLLAGILLGPSCFGSLLPELSALVFPVEKTQSYLLEVVSWLGVIFLLMLAGLETDLRLIRRQGVSTAFVAAFGGLLPFAAGVCTAFFLPGELLIDEKQRLVVGLFLGTALAVSSVPVIAKILIEMRIMRTEVGQLILSAALAQDIFGCIALALVGAMAGSEPISRGGIDPWTIAKPIGGTALFLAGLYLCRNSFHRLLVFVDRRVHVEHAVVTVVVCVLLLGAATTQFLGVHVVLGAFGVGVLLAQFPPFSERIARPLETVTYGIFAPIFFAAAGLHVNLTLLKDVQIVGAMVAITLLACAGKILGSLVGGMLGGLNFWDSLSVGFGTNARGAMGLVVGILGFSLGLLTIDLFSIVMVMALVTTAMTPPLLKWSLGRRGTRAPDAPRPAPGEPGKPGTLEAQSPAEPPDKAQPAVEEMPEAREAISSGREPPDALGQSESQTHPDLGLVPEPRSLT